MKRTGFRVLLVTVALLAVVAAPARAQVRGVEIGTSLMSLTINTDDTTATTFGVPSGGFGIVNPGLYMSVFMGPRFAIEPQIGLVLATSGGFSTHVLNLAGQADYFFKGSRASSPFVFGSVGLLSVSHAITTPVSFGGGVGYRKVFGERLAIRFDGRVTHYTKNYGNVVAFSVSLGGVFRQR